MRKIRPGDIVCFKDNGDVHSHVIETDGFNLKLKQFSSNDECVYPATIDDVSLICSMRDSTKVQLASLEKFASIIGYKLYMDKGYFVASDKLPPNRTDHRIISFNRMVNMHNHVGTGLLFKWAHSHRIVDRVKIQYSKRKKMLITQNQWVRYV